MRRSESVIALRPDYRVDVRTELDRIAAQADALAAELSRIIRECERQRRTSNASIRK